MNQKHMDSILPNYLYSLKKKKNTPGSQHLCFTGYERSETEQVMANQSERGFPILDSHLVSHIYHPSP